MFEELTELEKLVAVQRYEFSRAARLDLIVFILQTVTAVLAVLSVALPQGLLSGVLAPTSLGVIVAAFWFNHQSRLHRIISEKARRATLLVGGLGLALSQTEIRRLTSATGASPEELMDMHDPTFFATAEGPGVKRATDMLEESAFWSTYLFRASGDRVQWWMAIAVSMTAICFLLALQVFHSADTSLQVKFFSAIASSIVSIEFLTRCLLYRIAARDTDSVVVKLDHVRELNYPQDGFLWAMTEYNSAVESAPLMAPGVYKKNKSRIEQIWKDKGKKRGAA